MILFHLLEVSTWPHVGGWEMKASYELREKEEMGL